jgi:hypothetical protein
MKTKHGVFIGFAVIALAAIFTLAGCSTNPDPDEDDPMPKSIKITDFDVEIPETTNNKTGVKGKYLHMHVREGETEESSEPAYGQVINPSGQDIIFDLSNSGQLWTGTGSYYIWIEGPPKEDPTKSLSLNRLYLPETNKGAGKHKQAQIIFSLLFIAN